MGLDHKCLIFFLAEPCTKDGDVRLVDGLTSYDGRVAICLQEKWASVCYDKLGFRDAEVICRQLGYNESEYTPYIVHMLHMYSSQNSFIYCQMFQLFLFIGEKRRHFPCNTSATI